MNQITLTSVFLESRDKLYSKLESLSLPRDYKEIQSVINDHITRLLSGDNAFKESLNASDAEFLNSALHMALSFQQLNLAESIDFKTLSTKIEYNAECTEKKDANDIFENILTLLPALICAFINPWLTLVVGGGTVLVKKSIKTKKGGCKEVFVRERKVDQSHQISEKEINAIVTGIENICSEVDGIISKIRRDRIDLEQKMQDKLLDNSAIEKMYPQILSSLQYLFMEDLKAEEKNQYVQNILFNLQGYGYRVVEYSPMDAGFFAKKINPNVTEATMYLPAIVKDVKGLPVLAAEGVVYIPANSSNS